MGDLADEWEKIIKSLYSTLIKALNPLDQSYFEDLKNLLTNKSFSGFYIYKELTYIYTRYMSSDIPCRELPTFIEEDPSMPILNLISIFRNILAKNIINLYSKIIEQVESIVINTIKKKMVITNKLLFTIQNFEIDLELEEITIETEVSMCEFCEYLSSAMVLYERQFIKDQDFEFLLAISLFFGFVDKEDNDKWETISSFIVKVINAQTIDSNRHDGFYNFNGLLIYELFKTNDSLLRKNIRDVNFWVLAGYRFRMDNLMKEFNDIKESINREEYSLNTLSQCQAYIQEARNIYSSYIYGCWTVNQTSVRHAEKVIQLYSWAEYKIKLLED
ncbi:hypothetical protein SteCoe_9624 [Stentor coeruleus]|uniref:Uncharacterized protein n=1 Tax=Stentor coeruleus TaxID=5963 RepID=A0A1R2CHH3_9CILI|nr:hypothetical protein SteCoe_9624 [Stentor coeruleus]